MGLFGADFLGKLKGTSETLSPAAMFYIKEMMGGNLQRLFGNQNTKWAQHDERNADLAYKYMQMFGDWNRQQRDAKGFNSGYDAGKRWPEDIGALKTLAAGYQGVDALKSMLDPNVKAPIKDNFYDYQANISGLELAEKTKGKGPESDSAIMEQLSLDYADPFKDTTR
jgi:hypothetical protein